MTPDDDIERRLRETLRSRRLSVDPAPDALDRVHAGARRRQRRQRVAASGVAAVAVAAVVVGTVTAVSLRPQGNGTTVADRDRNASPTSAASSSPSLTFGSAQLTPPEKRAMPSAVPATIPPGGAPPKGFVPMSVTAINDKTYWVLGHAPCNSGVCAALAKTTDGGKTFTEVGAPPSALVPGDPGNKDVFGSDTISDVRFVDSGDGWAYGGGLWETSDGGKQWRRVPIGGSVQQLAVASGHVWAIVLTSASVGSGARYELYSRAYPDGTWSKVAAAGVFGPAEPALALQRTTVSVVGTDAATGSTRTARSTDGARFASAPAPPCAPQPGESMSTSASSLWLACSLVSDKLSGIAYSPDFGASWSLASQKLSGALTAIGAVDAKSAVVAVGSELVRLDANGRTSPVALPDDGGTPAAFAFIGFTNERDGFAIPVIGGSRQLWRTTDGGAHWSMVKF